MTRALRFAAVLLALWAAGGGKVAAQTAPAVTDVTIVSIPANVDTYGVGETIVVDVTWNNLVATQMTCAQIKLVVRIGSTDRSFDCQTEGITRTLRFSYAVVAADSDADGISIGASAVTGGTLIDAASASTPANRSLSGHTITNSGSHKVNGSQPVPAAPTVVGVALNSPIVGDTFERDEVIEATVTFSEAVDVTGTPQLRLHIGANVRQASYASGTGTTVIRFRYTVVQADSDTNGMSIPDGPHLGGTIRVAGGTANARRLLDSHAITNSVNHKVNGATVTAAAVSGVSITSTPANGDTYRLGEQIDVTVTFNRTVNVVTTGGTPQLALTVGTQTRQAAYVSGTGTTALVFNYSLVAGDFDGDGIGVAAGALTLNSGAINDARDVTVAAALGLGTHAIAGDAGHKVATPPFISTIGVNSPGSASTFERGERIEVTLNFNRAVDVTGTPQVALGIGTETRQADYVSGTGTTSPVFRYTVVQADSDPNGISIAANALTLNGGTIRAVTADRTDASLGLGSNAINDLGSRRVDGTQFTAAAVSTAAGAVSITSSPASSDTYALGERIEVRVRFTQRVDVTGTPQVELTVGAVPRQADYALGSGTNSLNFRYVVQNADADADGIAIVANALTLNGGAIDDARDATEAATLTHGAVAADANQKVNGTDLARAIPRVIGVAVVSAPPAGGSYRAGGEIRVRVRFDRLVMVTGSPQLALTIGTETRQAAYVSGSGTPDLVFRYVVRVGDADPNGISVAADALNDDGMILVVGELTGEAPGTPQPAAERDLGIHALPDQPGHAVDAPQPPPPEEENAAPAFVAGRFAFTLAENTAGPLALGVAEAVDPDEGDTLTYRLEAGDAERFEVDAATGEVRYVGGGEDYEADGPRTWELEVSATDPDGLSAEATVTVTLTNEDEAPSFGDARVPAQRYVQDTAITPLTLPAATGGDGPLAYTLSPVLPEGLKWTPPGDAASGGTLSGTPAVAAEEAPWTLTATDADGDTATLTFTVEVAPDLMPNFGDATVPAQRYVQDVEIAPLTLPAATGGNGPLTYTLSPVLPEGLEWTPPGGAATGGVLAGTPTVPGAPAAWTLAARDADGDRATLTFSIEVADRLRERLRGINEAILADLSRAMAASTTDAVSGRIGQALAPGGSVASGSTASAELVSAFAGVLRANEEAIGEGTWSWKQGLDGRRFSLALPGAGGAGAAGLGAAPNAGDGASPGGARVTVWGAGDYRGLAGGEGGVDWDGHLFGAHLGLDARFGAGGLGGLAFSMTEGRLDYTDTSVYALGEAVEGKYESRMRSAHPYVGWAWPSGAHAWASLGYGRGDVTILDGEAGRQESDSTMHSAAAGGAVRVFSGEGPRDFGPVAVDLKGEAWATRLEVDDNGERIAGLAVRTHRVRLSAEGSRAFALEGGGAFTPSVELGMRLDGGDGKTGAGVELGGGVDYAHPARGLSVDVSGRGLVAHEGGADDWSVGGGVRLEPASGLGLSLRLAPSYGSGEGRSLRLWEQGVAGSVGTTGESPSARLDTEMGYGLAAFAGVLTPYGGFALSEGGTRDNRLGVRFTSSPAFELGLEGERRESRSKRPEHGLMLRGRMRW